MPTLIYDIMRVMLALTGPAAFVCLVNAGIALRKEGGTVFWIGGGFSRWMLWTVIFLALEPTLVWFQFLGFPVFFPPGAAIGNSWLSGITTGLTTFVNDFGDPCDRHSQIERQTAHAELKWLHEVGAENLAGMNCRKKMLRLSHCFLLCFLRG